MEGKEDKSSVVQKMNNAMTMWAKSMGAKAAAEKAATEKAATLKENKDDTLLEEALMHLLQENKEDKRLEEADASADWIADIAALIKSIGKSEQMPEHLMHSLQENKEDKPLERVLMQLLQESKVDKWNAIQKGCKGILMISGMNADEVDKNFQAAAKANLDASLGLVSHLQTTRCHKE